MIKDKPLKVVQWFMTGVEKYLLRHFSSVKYPPSVEVSREKATLVLTNHFSFYDGAILHRLCRKLLKKHFKVMVVEAQMRNFKPLRYIGCFSVDRKSRSVVESLNYAAELLNDPSNMLGIYPQGEVYSVHLNRIHFENGLQHILNKTRKPVQVIFSVVLTDYLDSFKPHARVYLNEYQGTLQLAEMETAYNDFYSSCKEQQRALHNPPMRVRG